LQIEAALPELRRFLDASERAYQAADDRDLRRLLEDDWPLIYTGTIKQVDRLLLHFERRVNQAEQRSLDEARQRQRWSFVIGGGLVLLLIGTALWLLRRLSTAIRRLHDGLAVLSPDQAWADVVIPGNDEFAEMAKALNTTAGRWQKDRARLLELTVRNRLILESIGDGVYGTDRHGVITFVNPAGAAVLGWLPEELVGRPAHETFHHSHADGSAYPADECPFYRTYRDGQPHFSDDEVFFRRDGVAVPVQVNCAPLFDGDSVKGAVVTFQDITQRQQAQAALRQNLAELQALNRRLEEAQNQLLQSEKMASIGQLAAGVAHEINNPVGFVNSNLGTLKKYCEQMLQLLAAYRAGEDRITDQTLRARIAELRQALDLDYLQDDLPALINESEEGLLRVRKIVQDLKDFSHVNESEWTFADLNAGLDSTLNVVWNEVKYKARVVKQYGPIAPVECLASQLNQVFMNLIVNAVQALDPERGMGTLTLATGQQGDEVWVEVADDGKGMSEAVRRRIFEPFFTTKPVGQGTGLGLSLAFSIVQKHQGRIEVDSTPGQGTRFRVWVPVRRVTMEALA
ncbi:MAG TPA: ATP-binding protein, partial [Rhodocyclaceae bacterium]|nr:ATP-binding protein [Rhodocyclaceae bacterium]